MRRPPRPRALIESRRVLVLVGSGGVGKTTVAAAWALEAARAGRHALVITIDPARRLAGALGLESLGNEPQAIPRATLDRLGVPGDAGLSAMMLDMKRTLDGLVERFAEDEQTQRRIFDNRIYQHVSDALAGSAEYAAMEKVFELSERREFDLIVVDTPPAQHALDFLETPQRLIEFLDSRIVKLLLHPAFSAGRLGFRVFQRSAYRVLSLIERISGVGFLDEISDFLLAFEGMSEGFRERAGRLRGLLLGPECSFVLVAGAARESVHAATGFLGHLERSEVPLAGVVVNRARTWPAGPVPEAIPERGCEDEAHRALAEALRASSAGGETRDAAGDDADRAAHAAIAAAARYAAVVRHHAADARPLREAAAERGLFWRVVPEFGGDVHDLDGLALVADHVFGDQREG